MEKTFEGYFSFEAILGDLVKWRIAGKDVDGTLPPRKMWSRAGVKDRKGVDPAVVRKQAIFRTIMRYCKARPQLPPHLYKSGGNRNRFSSTGKLDSTTWGRKLMELVEGVREAVFSGKVAFEPPKMFRIAKGREDGKMTYREVASFERLADRVILSRMTAYVRDRLEGILSDRCYSFRRDRDVTHQQAVKHLQEYRARFPVGSLFVAECDIRKFFDSISHEVVRRRWNEVGFDVRAGKVLEAYLGVYAVGAVAQERDPPEKRDADGGMAVAQERDPPDGVRRGLPQGGSFSTVLANLVLAEADRAVMAMDDGRLFYARYCDDVVFVHPDEAMCRRAMDAYAAALDRLDLPMHPVEAFVYRREDDETTRYYSLKSKGPFRWREAVRGEVNCAPWVSFLGSQVCYDGETRIRKESVEKHIRSLGRTTAAAVRELQAGTLEKAARPEIAEWFGRFRNGLIAKGVGYVTAKVKDCDMCWAGAFPHVTPCVETRMQMRRLDRVREGMLAKVAALLPARYYMTGHRYKGHPFSYSGFLEKAVRPTNMDRRRRVAVLPYSEL